MANPPNLPTDMVDGTDMGDDTPGSTAVGTHVTWHRDANRSINDLWNAITNGAKGVINHGSDASVARQTVLPGGTVVVYQSYEWKGTVAPTNGTSADTWVDTT